MSAISTLLSLGRKIAKFGPYIPLSNFILIYGKRLISENTAKKINNKRIFKINKKLLHIINTVNESEISLPTPKVSVNNAIWVCWLQGDASMPPLAKLCLSSIRKNANNHEVILLTNENYSDYVELPGNIINLYKSGKLKQAHFADMIRINLLAQQGGLWLDSTMLLTNKIPEDIFTHPFFTIKSSPFGHFVSKCRWAVFTLASQPQSPLFAKLSKAFELYFERTSVFIDYFLFDHFIDLLYQTDPEIKRMIDVVPFNNPNVHALNPILCDAFDEEVPENLQKDTYLFKLSNHTYSKDKLKEDNDSFFNYFKTLYSKM